MSYPINSNCEQDDAGTNRAPCPDCYQCQQCSLTRCRACCEGNSRMRTSGLDTGFTYGQYLDWKNQREVEKNSRN